MRRADGRRTRWSGLAAAVVVLSVGATLLPFEAALAADERLTEIGWAHPSPEQVRRFVVLVSPTEATTSDTRFIEVGKPAGQPAGVMRFYTAIVSMSEDEFVAVGAVGANGIMTAMSEWGTVPPTRPGQPLVIEP